jgi:hypothetical protein
MKMTVFWDVTPCSLVEIKDISEVLTASIIRAISKDEYRPDDGGDKRL